MNMIGLFQFNNTEYFLMVDAVLGLLFLDKYLQNKKDKLKAKGV
jgi:hypothetical protein